MLGLSLSAFTTLHVVLSLIGIVAGLVVALGMLGGKRLPVLTAVFLVTTVLTSVTGFLFPFHQLLPSHVFGIISLVVLVPALAGVYGFRLAGAWRWIYVVTALIALYLNVFVGVVQAFQKLAFLQPFAPTQSEPPFLVAQLVVLAIFLLLGFLAVRKFHPQPRRSVCQLTRTGAALPRRCRLDGERCGLLLRAVGNGGPCRIRGARGIAFRGGAGSAVSRPPCISIASRCRRIPGSAICRTLSLRPLAPHGLDRRPRGAGAAPSHATRRCGSCSRSG